MTRLLLFTNEYPYATGDAAFVEKEIGALAGAFGDVVVFCHARDTSAGMLELPEGVSYGGNLFEPAPEDAPRKLIEPGAIRLFLSAAWRELVSGRFFRHPVYFTLAAKVGITQAHRTAVREAIAGADDVVAYGFWAMGGGQAVPWLQGVRARTTRVHRYDLYEEDAPYGYLPFRPFLYARADRVLAISHHAEDYLREHHPQSRGKVVLSRLGAYGPAAVPQPSDDGPVTIVSCSAVREVKRVDRIAAAVRALPGVSAERPVRWVHFGDGPLMEHLREACADLPEGLQIDLRGQVPNSEVTGFYATDGADLFVNLSDSEGVPVSIMEAIAHGVPVLASAVGGTPEIVGPELGTGELVDAGAPAASVAAVMRRMLDAPAETYHPRALWEREYDADRAARLTAELVRTAGR